MSALKDLEEYLEKDEVVEAIIFGAWGWSGFGEPEPNPLPHELFGKIMTFDEAKQYMKDWSFYGGYGSPDCYAVNIYTNKRVIWVTQYDGSTNLSSMPRNPIEGEIPDMPGG